MLRAPLLTDADDVCIVRVQQQTSMLFAELMGIKEDPDVDGQGPNSVGWQIFAVRFEANIFSGGAIDKLTRPTLGALSR